MSRRTKAALFLKIWFWFFVVHIRLRTDSLPKTITRLTPSRHSDEERISPVRLGGIVTRVLGIAGLRPRCLISALVDYRLLAEQGHPAEVVIGLMPDAPSADAHAWIEIGGIDVGPPPGRGAHVALARYR